MGETSTAYNHVIDGWHIHVIIFQPGATSSTGGALFSWRLLPVVAQQTPAISARQNTDTT